MKKKTTGIVDPFNEPKAEKPPIESPYDDPYGLASEEQYLRPPPTLDLDGDSFIIRFLGGVEPDNATEALVKLLYDVNTVAKAHLAQHGVWIGNVEPQSMVLKSPFGTISVYGAANEIEVFRRIGATLWTLPDKNILKNHRVKIVRRG